MEVGGFVFGFWGVGAESPHGGVMFFVYQGIADNWLFHYRIGCALFIIGLLSSVLEDLQVIYLLLHVDVGLLLILKEC